jgi:hypothetical protein
MFLSPEYGTRGTDLEYIINLGHKLGVNYAKAATDQKNHERQNFSRYL